MENTPMSIALDNIRELDVKTYNKVVPITEELGQAGVFKVANILGEEKKGKLLPLPSNPEVTYSNNMVSLFRSVYNSLRIENKEEGRIEFENQDGSVLAAKASHEVIKVIRTILILGISKDSVIHTTFKVKFLGILGLIRNGADISNQAVLDVFKDDENIFGNQVNKAVYEILTEE